MSRSAAPDVGPPLGALLRRWRDVRGKSQLELALDMGVSQRHLSFIETGRSVPSRVMIKSISEALAIPFRERNALLLSAGYAPAYSEAPLTAEEMGLVNRALERMLRQHEPFPAIVLDRYWDVVRVNAAAPRFFGSFIDLSQQPKTRNLLRIMFDPKAMRPFVHNWAEVAASLLERVHRESTSGIIDARLQHLMVELKAQLPALQGPGPQDSDRAGPVIPIEFVKDGQLLKYFSMVSTVGTPQAVASQELRVESMFPADDFTEQWHLATFS